MAVDYHKPVLLKEVIEGLDIKPGNWYIDATLGDGGHSLAILSLGGRVLGIDVDPKEIERARKRLQGAGYRQQDFKTVLGNFRELDKLIPASTSVERGEQTETKYSGALFDFGVSSLQLDTPERGFSFKDGPLDMRLDPNLSVKALDLVKGLNRGELYELFSKLGEEKLARAVADAIISSRGLINTTKDLAELVASVYRRFGIKNQSVHPATRIFQALRIAVNDELNVIKEGLPQALNKVQKNGYIVVTSFHSLEDRIIKNLFKGWEDQGLGQILTKKPIVPKDEEVEMNPRSRSAKLRIFKKI